MSLKIFAASQNPKFKFLKKVFGKRPFRLLDIGAGNHSAIKTTRIFPNCEYHGVDMERSYNNSETDFKLMQAFYEMDLTRLDFKTIPDSYFDAILIVHVIEHLYNGDEVIKGLLPKLKKGGCIYIEYPGKKSTTLPSMYGTLNFKDDPTHVRLYSVKELNALLVNEGMALLKSGTRRSAWYISILPLRIAGRWIRGKRVSGNIFWDLLGFAEFVSAKK